MHSRPDIDTLRGVACLLLVAFHVVGHDESTGLHLADEHLVVRVNDWLRLLRMPLFSFLSGLVYALRPVQGPVGPFLRGKARRLLVPMLLVGTGFAVLQSLVKGTGGRGYDWTLLHVVPVAHYWFLESLFIVFAVTALLERTGALDSAGRFAAAWVASAVLHVTAPAPVYFGLQGATYLLPFFLAGIAAHRFHAALFRPDVLRPLALVPVGVGLYLSAAAAPSGASLPTLAFSVCCCLLLLRSGLRVNWLAWIGGWSFGIYLFHPVFTAASRESLVRLGVQELPALFGAGLLAGIAGSILFTATLRKLPLGHLPLGESA